MTCRSPADKELPALMAGSVQICESSETESAERRARTDVAVEQLPSGSLYCEVLPIEQKLFCDDAIS